MNFKTIKKYLRRFWKYVIIESERYGRAEHNRYTNGFYDRSDKPKEEKFSHKEFQEILESQRIKKSKEDWDKCEAYARRLWILNG